MSLSPISYRFDLPSGKSAVFDLMMFTDEYRIFLPDDTQVPDWAKLDFHQCPNCPLDASIVNNCPMMAALAQVIRQFDGVLSYDKLTLTVTTPERHIQQDTTAQKGLSALMGLIIASSGCPHTEYFRPMARFHLPLATEEETLYRAASMYLLAQYIRKTEGLSADIELDGLADIYENIQVVNATVAKRLRAATSTDASVNAVIHLDVYAKVLPMAVDECLADLRHLFGAYLKS